MLPNGKKKRSICLRYSFSAFILLFFYASSEQILVLRCAFFYAYVDGSHFSTGTLKPTMDVSSHLSFCLNIPPLQKSVAHPMLQRRTQMPYRMLRNAT